MQWEVQTEDYPNTMGLGCSIKDIHDSVQIPQSKRPCEWRHFYLLKLHHFMNYDNDK